MANPVDESGSEACFFDSFTSVGLPPDQEAQLQADLNAIEEAGKITDPNKREAAIAPAMMKYQFDYTVFTNLPPLSAAQIAVLTDDYNQTVHDSQITYSNPSEIFQVMQLDWAKFNMDILFFTHSLTQDQVDTLARDYAQLEVDNQIADSETKWERVQVSFARFNLDMTLFTYPELSSWEITQLEIDFANLAKDSQISDKDDRSAAIVVNSVLLEKDTLTYLYPLTSDEQSKIDTIYNKLVKDSMMTGPQRMPQMNIDWTEFEDTKAIIIQNHSADPTSYHSIY